MLPGGDVLSLELPQEFDLQGAKVSHHDHTSYHPPRDPRKNKKPKPRPATVRNIQLARAAIHACNGVLGLP